MTQSELSGLELSRQFYQHAVRPLLDAHYPSLPHTACLIGSGSEVLGFDDRMSPDHGWGPRLQILLPEDAFLKHGQELKEFFSRELPYRFKGYSTNFSAPDPDADDSPVMAVVDTGPIHHGIEINTIRGYIAGHLNFDIQQELQPPDWLSFSEQRLRTLIEGAVYHDDLDFAATRARFHYYPHDVWLYLMMAGWARIGQEEHLLGRAGYAGDEIGSAIIGGRLVRDIMRLCFLMEKTYAPYPKWFGTAFKLLNSGSELAIPLADALAARSWTEREAHLVLGYEHLARKHNELALADPLPDKAVPFFDRPFKVITFNGYGRQLSQLIRDPQVKQIATRPPIGMIDQFSDSTDLLADSHWRPKLRQLYEP